MRYQDYLRTDHWFRIRVYALLLARFCCEFCGRPANDDGPLGLDVHHLNYDCLDHEEPADLIVLCRDCHTDAHQFPKRLAEIHAFAAKRWQDRMVTTLELSTLTDG